MKIAIKHGTNSDVPMLLFSGKASALFSDGDCIGHITPARDTTVKHRH